MTVPLPLTKKLTRAFKKKWVKLLQNANSQQQQKILTTCQEGAKYKVI